MERAAVQPTRHWAIADYFQRTSENVLILRRVLRPRRICDIYDLFASCINLLTYLLTNGHTDGRAIAYTLYLLHNAVARNKRFPSPLKTVLTRLCTRVTFVVERWGDASAVWRRYARFQLRRVLRSQRLVDRVMTSFIGHVTRKYRQS